jgi:hypothetical protein
MLLRSRRIENNYSDCNECQKRDAFSFIDQTDYQANVKDLI